MINCQMDDTDNNCLRVQTERGRRWGLPEKASQVNFRLYSWKNPGTADGSSEIVKGGLLFKEEGGLYFEFRHPGEKDGTPPFQAWSLDFSC